MTRINVSTGGFNYQKAEKTAKDLPKAQADKATKHAEDAVQLSKELIYFLSLYPVLPIECALIFPQDVMHENLWM